MNEYPVNTFVSLLICTQKNKNFATVVVSFIRRLLPIFLVFQVSRLLFFHVHSSNEKNAKLMDLIKAFGHYESTTLIRQTFIVSKCTQNLKLNYKT